MTKRVYFFGKGKADGNAKMRSLLGGKGANLAEMTNIGIPVPPGFTIGTNVCDYFNQNDGELPPELHQEIDKALSQVEQVMNKKFGDPENPLLVSVRSGAAVSMPGMMDTVLNLGLNDETINGLAKSTNERMAWDSYRRFIDMFGGVVMGIEHDDFEEELSKIKKKAGAKNDTDLSVEQMKEVVSKYREIYKKNIGKDFPVDVREQLNLSIKAVFSSWSAERAVSYRAINKLTGLLGTAVNVQTMVFGNMGDNSGTGVAFTRDPSLGINEFYGEFLINAQGEDVVAGIRTPLPISGLKDKWPSVYQELMTIRDTLEKNYKDMQDIEFTIQEGQLFMLQTRSGKRTGKSAITIARAMVDEGLITQEQAVLQVDGDHINQLLFPVFDDNAKQSALTEKRCIGSALPAGPGAACGRVVFTANDAVAWKDRGEKIVLVRHETSPEDVSGMWAAEGILTSTGGMTSHAAVVARGWGKCCVVGFNALNLNYGTKQIKCNGYTIKEGDWISVDGSTGEVFLGKIDTKDSPIISALIHKDEQSQKDPMYGAFKSILEWADEFRTMKVRTNADTPKDSSIAVSLGAQGIGLTRTEHMFFEGERIWAVREFILAPDEASRNKALDKLLPFQREDFEGIFEAMNGLPVTIRLLDPPLHEFLPGDQSGIEEMAKRMNLDEDRIKSLIQNLHEMNPMLGHRGCRLSITYPELAVMQTRAIIEAACNKTKAGIKVYPEIMVPLIGTKEEFNYLDKIIRKVANDIISKSGIQLEYMVGTMIEIPRAAITAGEVAETAEFFSFGTNDLTQMAFGYSRDDVGGFLPDYVAKGIVPADPFQTIDQSGVGVLVKMAVEAGRKNRPNLKLGICGEHGGEPESVKFCHRTGLDYVSCSPYRVPVARIAAAQAAIIEKRGK